jgi:hypothetical protein
VAARELHAIVFFICLVLFLDCVLLLPEARFYCKGSVHAIPHTTVVLLHALPNTQILLDYKLFTLLETVVAFGKAGFWGGPRGLPSLT